VCGLVAGATEDLAGARIDVDPDDAAAAHELQAVDAGAGIELWAEIVSAAHARQNARFDRAERQEMAVPSALIGRLLLALARTCIGRRRQRRGADHKPEGGGKEGGTQGHLKFASNLVSTPG
jgi:hypothetical protein